MENVYATKIGIRMAEPIFLFLVYINDFEEEVFRQNIEMCGGH